MIEHGKKDDDCAAFYSHKYEDGWSVCLDVYYPDCLWETQSDDDEKLIKERLGGPADEQYPAVMYCHKDDMYEDRFLLGIRLEDGKATNYELYGYEKNIPLDYMTIDYSGNKTYQDFSTGEYKTEKRPSLLGMKFNKFTKNTVEINLKDVLEEAK